MAPPTITESRVVIPRRPARNIATESAQDLVQAIDACRAWGISTPTESRAQHALEILREVERTGRFAPHQRGDDLGLRAVQLALDLKDITAALPAVRVADLRKDLSDCLKGKLGSGADEHRALQLQSQLIVQAALKTVGAQPTQPTHSGAGGRKKPDLLLANGLAEYALEVKRPTKAKNIISRTLDASEQIAASKNKGGIVIDVTDCLKSEMPADADSEVTRWMYMIADVLFKDGLGYRSGQDHVLMLTVFARPTWALDGSETGGDALVHVTSAGIAFGVVRGTLDHHRGQWLRRLVASGLQCLGFTGAESS